MMKYISFLLIFWQIQLVFSQADTPKMTPNIPFQLIKQQIEIPLKFINTFPKNVTVNLPQEFSAKVFYAGPQLKKPRFFAWGPDSVLHVADLEAGSIFAFPDNNKDGIADTIQIAATNVIAHDIKFFENALYAAQEKSVLRLTDTNNDGFYETRSLFIDKIAEGAAQPGGGHTTRTILFDSAHQKMYLSIGSRCNVCRWDNETNTDYLRAQIEQWNIDGTGRRTFANGIRNAVGLLLRGGKVWGANNGSDNQGNEIPPEWIDIIRENGFYGYPFAHSDGIFFPVASNSPADYKALLPYNVRDSQLVASMKQPAALIQSHSAPMALVSSQKNMPLSVSNGVFVALRGSWNRNPATGGKIVFLGFDNENDTTANFVADFLTGFMTDSSKSSNWGWARPVGLETDNRGNLYIGSDANNRFILVISPKAVASVEQTFEFKKELISIIRQQQHEYIIRNTNAVYQQADIMVYDLLGNIHKHVFSGVLSSNMDIPMQLFTTGFYIVRIALGDGRSIVYPLLVQD